MFEPRGTPLVAPVVLLEEEMLMTEGDRLAWCRCTDGGGRDSLCGALRLRLAMVVLLVPE